jgi:hypothetical protein
VTPPLQPGIIGHIWYMLYGSLAICHLREPVVSTILGCNQWPTVPRVLHLNNSPQAFYQAGGRSRSLDGRQNRNSYVIAGAAVGFSGEFMG